MADEQTPPPEEQPAGTPGNEGQGSDEAVAPDQPAPPAADAEETAGNEGEAPAEEETPAPAEEPAPAVAEEPAAEQTAAPDEPAPAEEPAPAVAEETAAPDEPAPAEEPAPAAAEAADEPAAEAPAPAAAEASEEPRRQRPPRRDEDEQPDEPAVVPGAHLEPDLVLEEKRPAEGEYADPYADPSATADDDSPIAEGETAASVEETPAARTPLELAADARYRATGKRKRAIARVILKPGEGTYTINGKELDVYFPRVTLQKHCRLPLETTNNASRMDVVAKIHGGGVSAQATALRHGIARALVEADPNLRGELKRHGFLTRDARVKERKKAGLKKARKRPQFSKR
jgi:small subunit ribosomal protein S9